MMEVSDVIAKKATLCSTIFKLINEFELETDVQVDNVHLHRACGIGYTGSTLQRVQVEARLP